MMMIHRRYLLRLVPFLALCAFALPAHAMDSKKPLTAVEWKTPVPLHESPEDRETIATESAPKHDEAHTLIHATDSKVSLIQAQSLLRLRNIRIPRKASPETVQKRFSLTGQQVVKTEGRMRKKNTKKNQGLGSLAQAALTMATEEKNGPSESQPHEVASSPSMPPSSTNTGTGLPKDIQQLIQRFSVCPVENLHSYLTMACHRRFSLNKETGVVVQGDFEHGIDSMARSPDGIYYADCYNTRGTSIYNAHTGMLLHTFYRDRAMSSHGAPFAESSHDVAAWNPRGTLIAVGGEVGVRIFEAASGELVYKSAAKEFPGVTQIAWSADGAYVAILHQTLKISVACVATKEVVYAVDHSYVPVRHDRQAISHVQSIQWSPCGLLLAIAHRNKGNVDILNVAVRETMCSFWCETYAKLVGERMMSTDVKHFKWSPNGDYLAIDYGARIGVINVREKRAVCLLKSGSYFSWSADSTRLAVVWGLAGAEIYDLNLGDRAYVISDPVYHCAWSPDGAYLAVVRMQDIHLHNGHTGQLMQELLNCKGIFSWSPDSSYLMAASQDGLLCLYDVYAKKITLLPCTDPIKSIQFSRDGVCFVNLTTQTTLVYDLLLFTCLTTLSLPEYELLKKLDMSDSVMPLVADAQEWKMWEILRVKLPERAQKSIGQRIIRGPRGL